MPRFGKRMDTSSSKLSFCLVSLTCRKNHLHSSPRTGGQDKGVPPGVPPGSGGARGGALGSSPAAARFSHSPSYPEMSFSGFPPRKARWQLRGGWCWRRVPFAAGSLKWVPRVRKGGPVSTHPCTVAGFDLSVLSALRHIWGLLLS